VHGARCVVFACLLVVASAALAEQQLSDPARHATAVRLAATSEHALLVWSSIRPNEVTGVLLNHRAERIGEPFTIASDTDLREPAVAASDRDYLVVWQNFAARRLEAAVVDPAAPHQDSVTLSSSLLIINPTSNGVYAYSPRPRVIWNGRQYVVFWMAADGLLHAATLDAQLKVDREVAIPLDSPPLALASQQLGDVMMAVAHPVENRVTLYAAVLNDRLELHDFQTIATATPALQPAYNGSQISSAAAVPSGAGYVVSWIRKQQGGANTIEITATAADGTPLDTAAGADGNVYGKVVGRADAEAYGLQLQRSAGMLSALWYRRDSASHRHYDMPHLGGFIAWLDASTLQLLHAPAKVLPPIDAVASVAVGDQTIVAYIPRGNVIDYHYPDTTVYATFLNYTPPRRRAVRSASVVSGGLTSH
jgi:hypothetical protein